MVESTEIDYTVCRFPPDPMFASISEIERASKRYRADRYDPEAINVLQSYREFRICCIETSLGILEKFNLPERILVSARLKRMESIYRKLQRSKESTHVSNIDDVIGFRVIFRSLDDLLFVVAAVKKHKGITMKDYLVDEHPNGHGYRGVHVIFRFEQPFNEKKRFRVRFEAQLRTYYQHCWACWCEGMGEQAKEGYRNRRDEPEIIETINNLKNISDRIKIWEESNPSGAQGAGDPFLMSEDITRRFAVVRRNGEIDSCSNGAEAFDYLMGYEEQNLDALLLLGLSGDDIKKHLQKTHINFLLGRAYQPEVWMPADM